MEVFGSVEEYVASGNSPEFTDPGAIFDIRACTVIQKGLELAESA